MLESIKEKSRTNVIYTFIQPCGLLQENYFLSIATNITDRAGISTFIPPLESAE
jgi:hypothetical protein